MREALALALLAAGMTGCAWHAEQAFGLKNSPSSIWLDDRAAPELVDDPKGLVSLERRIDKGDLPEIKFALGSAEIPYEYFPALDAVADWLMRHPDHKLRLTAHTCDIGTDDYNMDLSRRRAKSIKAYLAERGVPPPSIRFQAVGEQRPLLANDSEDHRRLNRSVQLRFVRRDWDSVY